MKKVSIGTVKRDISELVNRVAYGGERIVLTSRGKPKAALVPIQDYHRLEGTPDFQCWLEDADRLNERILARRGGEPIDLDWLSQSEKEDRERRDDRILGR